MSLFPVGLGHYLLVSALLFGLGAFGVATRRNAISALMSTELMLSAACINFAAFNHFRHPAALGGQVFALFIIAMAAAEASVGMALVVALFRQKRAVALADIDLMKG
jgi:NADH-quinone oxidoreductase subunit K